MSDEQTREFYDQCPKHRLWHDVNRDCELCLYEEIQEDI